jgi:hypothetical protein
MTLWTLGSNWSGPGACKAWAVKIEGGCETWEASMAEAGSLFFELPSVE